jgi:hypothetical protein
MIVKMSARCDISVCIPGNCVRSALGDIQIAMGANPSFTVISVCSCCGLHYVFDIVLEYSASNSYSNRIEIEFGALSLVLARTLGTITARHLVPAKLI